MRTSAQVESLIRRNARACETARRRQCNCLCKGKYHRKEHPEDWLEEVINQQTEEVEEDGS